MTTSRLEAFSDDVFAIAITLLVLELHIPEQPKVGLASALVDQWPAYASYTVSFFIIGIIWINHHGVFDHLVRVDRTLLFLAPLLEGLDLSDEADVAEAARVDEVQPVHVALARLVSA